MIEKIPEVDSTNRYLAEEQSKRKFPSGFVVYAEKQTRGRGQAGNFWEAEKGKNLTFSVFFQPKNLQGNLAFAIAEIASLSVKYTLDRYIPEVSVKWPNDVYYRDKKIAGILIENVFMSGIIEHSIIGIGININQMQFLSNAPNPVSLSQITGVTYEKTDILDEFVEIFTEQGRRLDNHCFDEIHHGYLEAIYRKEGYHKYRDSCSDFDAKIHTVEPAGHLILERTDGRLSKYAFKEVAWLY